MAVNTTTNQVYIPGFETNISSVVTPIAYTTTAAVTSLQSAIPGQFSTLTNKIANPATSRDDSEVSPYPLFGIWTNQDNSRKAGYSVINSDFQVVENAKAASEGDNLSSQQAEESYSIEPSDWIDYRTQLINTSSTPNLFTMVVLLSPWTRMYRQSRCLP